MQRFFNASPKTYLLLSTAVIIAFILILHQMGQVWICKCGYIKLWHGITFSSENSQHISDWYSFSHIIHGFALFGLLWLLATRLPIVFRLILALFFEISCEIFENTDFIINRYRKVTISLNYYGDSVLNS